MYCVVAAVAARVGECVQAEMLKDDRIAMHVARQYDYFFGKTNGLCSNSAIRVVISPDE